MVSQIVKSITARELFSKHKEIKKLANYVTSYDGGYGAVREVADLILWVNKLYKKFYREDVYKLFKEQ